MKPLLSGRNEEIDLVAAIYANSAISGSTFAMPQTLHVTLIAKALGFRLFHLIKSPRGCA